MGRQSKPVSTVSSSTFTPTTPSSTVTSPRTEYCVSASSPYYSTQNNIGSACQSSKATELSVSPRVLPEQLQHSLFNTSTRRTDTLQGYATPSPTLGVNLLYDSIDLEKMEPLLSQLAEMGFWDEMQNIKLLLKNNYDVTAAVEELLKQASQPSLSSDAEVQREEGSFLPSNSAYEGEQHPQEKQPLQPTSSSTLASSPHSSTRPNSSPEPSITNIQHNKGAGVQGFAPRRTILVNYVKRGTMFAKLAIEADKQQQWKKAFEYYLSSIECLIEGLKDNHPHKTKELITTKISEYMKRAGMIREVLREDERSHSTDQADGANQLVMQQSPRRFTSGLSTSVPNLRAKAQPVTVSAPSITKRPQQQQQQQQLVVSASTPDVRAGSKRLAHQLPIAVIPFAEGGNLVDTKHIAYPFIAAFALGFQVAMHNVDQAHVVVKAVDANAERRYVFSNDKSPGTYPSWFNFSFLDHAPRVFRSLRETNNISHQRFVSSLLQGAMKAFGSPGKSGSMFYLTSDKTFLLKTVSDEEFTFFKRILLQYYEFLQANRHSLICQFYGLYSLDLCVEDNIRKRIHFIVMQNIAPVHKYVRTVYDLKVANCLLSSLIKLGFSHWSNSFSF